MMGKTLTKAQEKKMGKGIYDLHRMVNQKPTPPWTALSQKEQNKWCEQAALVRTKLSKGK